MLQKNDNSRPMTKGVFLFIALTLAGCAGDPPVAKLSIAEQALNQADMNEGDKFGPLEMRIAREKYDAAKEAMNAEEYEEAARLADEAAVDAQLAYATARSQRTNKELADLQDSISSLRRELGLE